MKIKASKMNNQNSQEYSSDMESLFDKYIDLGLEKFILKNKHLLDLEKEELIGRIRICRLLNIEILNSNGELIDFLFEEGFLYDKFTIELITTNNSYKYIDATIKRALESSVANVDISNIIRELKEYDYSLYSYKIGNLFISKNRLYKNIKKLFPFLEEEGLDKIIFLSIIYQGCYTNSEIEELLEMKNQKMLIKQ